MSKFKTLEEVEIDSVTHGAGVEVELSDEAAAPLMDAGKLELVSEGTGVHAYAIDQLLRQMIARAQSLGLRVIDAPDVTMQKLLVVLTMQTTGLVNAGFPKVAL